MEGDKDFVGDIALDAVDAPVSEVQLTPEESAEVDRLVEGGVFYGQNHSRTNPKMGQYILTSKGGVEIIDLTKTLKALTEAQELIREKVLAGEEVVLVGTTPAGKGLVKKLGEELKLSNVTERWLGGTLTNFKTLSDRIRYFKKLKADAESGALDKYTKKERVDFNREIGKLTRFFGGIEQLGKLPGLVIISKAVTLYPIIFGLSGNETPAREARKTGVKSIAIVSTASDPDMVDIAIPGNESNPKSLEVLATYLEKAISVAKQELADKANLATASNNG
ncbi:30S ribosomal protein S2 [Patescibacteria group bacterium]|nr:30S ribosomal protein S2 [Patescibacteria group bacterium]